jgi:hypothetical protein
VRTYVHALKLHEERLQDARKRQGELENAIDKKRLELMQLRSEQMNGRQHRDAVVDAQMDEIRARIKQYEKPVPALNLENLEAVAAASKGLVQLSRKAPDGESIVPVQIHTNAAE